MNDKLEAIKILNERNRENFINNLNYLIKNSGLTAAAVANIANIPITTLNSILNGKSINPRLDTLSNIARVFNIKIAQLIGEHPLESTETFVPIISWDDLKEKKYKKSTKKGISSRVETDNNLFSLEVNENHSKTYKTKTNIIVEENDNICRHDLVIVSLDKSDPIIKKVIKEGNDIFFSSIDEVGLPLHKYDSKKDEIYGIIRETIYLN